MINKVNINDEDKFLKLGFLVNEKFDKLFDLNFIIDSSNEDVFGYYDGDKLIGFVHVLKTFECLEIINIVVDLDYRRKGIAISLINYVIDFYNDLEYILLEVNEKNDSAINLYKKIGFYLINIRKKYYGNEDALIMRKEVNV